MVWGGSGLTNTELKQMDLAEYREAVEARVLYFKYWLPEAKERAKANQTR